MNRRGFFQRLIGIAAGALCVPAAKAQPAKAIKAGQALTPVRVYDCINGGFMTVWNVELTYLWDE